MAKEPILTFKLSRPDKFHCSECPDIGDQGAFVITSDIRDLIASFKAHVGRYHTKEDASQAAARVVRESTRDK